MVIVLLTWRGYGCGVDGGSAGLGGRGSQVEAGRGFTDGTAEEGGAVPHPPRVPSRRLTCTDMILGTYNAARPESDRFPASLLAVRVPIR